jgi:hypothetical protein
MLVSQFEEIRMDEEETFDEFILSLAPLETLPLILERK